MIIGLFFFFSGLATGYYATDAYKDARIEAFESLIELEVSDDYYFIEDHMGQIWAVEPGRCVQVF